MKRYLFLCALSLLFSRPLFAATFNVTDSTGFQNALNTAGSNGEDNTINLAAGTYSSSSGFTYSATRHTLNIVGANTNAADDATIITSNSGSGIHFIFSGSINVSGITVQNCAASGLLFENASDDPVVATFNVSIQDSHFTGNGASGVIIDDQLFVGPVEVKDSIFDHNTHSSDGGALYVYVPNDNSSVTLTGNSFDQNHSDATGGGAWLKTLSIDGTDMTVGGSGEGEGNSFTSNTAETGSAGIYIGTDCNMSFVGNTLIGNTIPIDIAHFGATGGGVIIQYAGTGEFSNNVIQDNSASSSGGFGVGTFLEGSVGTINMNANLVSGNTSEDYGGGSVAMAVLSSPIMITNNIIVDNNVTSSSSTVGGLNVVVPSYATSVQEIAVINNTFSQNSAETYFAGGLAISPQKAGIVANVYNNIFYKDDSPLNMKDVYVNAADPAWGGLNFYNNDIVNADPSNTTNVCIEDPNDSYTVKCNNGNDFSNLTAITGVNVGPLNGSNEYTLYGVDPGFFGLGDLVEQYSLAANSPMIQAGDPSAPQLPEFDYTGTVPMDTPNPDLGALQYCIPHLAIEIQSTSEEVVLGENVIWNVSLPNSANCASSNNTLTLSFTNAQYQSAELAAGLSQALDRVFASSSSVFCTGSGTTATCTITNIPNASAVNLSVVATTQSLGTTSLSASLSNALGTASASGTGTASVVPNAGLSGGCSMHKNNSENCLNFFIFAGILFLSLFKIGISRKAKQN